MNPSLKLPKPAAAYFDAVNHADREAFLSAFAADAVVLDDGKEIHGSAAIQEWGERSHFADNLTLEVRKAEQRGEETVVTARGDGDYDKTGLPDPLLMDFHFTVKDNRISRLFIGFSTGE